jgi:LysR family transcriptional regulator for metE and metH
MVMGMIELRHLRLLRAVAQHRTLTRAAVALALSQSALSRQLLDLEDHLGRALFVRRHRSLIPTQAGQELTALAAGVLPELEAAEARVRASEDEAPLRVATECYTCYRWLPQVLRELRRRHPAQRIVIDVDATRNPVDAVLHDAIDLAIVSAPRRDRRLVSVPAFTDELVIVVGPGHPLAGRSHLEARDLSAETLFTFDVPFEETVISRRLFRPAGVRPAHVHRVPFTEAILELVSAGLGVAALAGWAVAPQVAAGRLAQMRITRRGLKRNWHLLRRRRASAGTEELVQMVRDALRPDRLRSLWSVR